MAEYRGTVKSWCAANRHRSLETYWVSDGFGQVSAAGESGLSASAD